MSEDEDVLTDLHNSTSDSDSMDYPESYADSDEHSSFSDSVSCFIYLFVFWLS